jgi:hypothetical protein
MARPPFGKTPHRKKRIILSCFLFVLALSFVVFMSCKNEPTTVQVNDGTNTGTGNIDPGTSGEFLLAAADGGDIVLGKLELWAYNLTTDPDSGTVSFDAILVNSTEAPIYPPIRFVITSLSPPSVTVVNPSGYDGMGHPFFDFSRKLGPDGVLSPFEKSQPMRFIFHTGPPTSFVIGYRFDFAWQPAGKVIAGAVFADLNNNGVRERCEPGIPRVVVTLDSRSPDGAAIHKEARTDENGQFMFSGLAVGVYSVAAMAPLGASPTTPNPVLVTLAGDQENIVGVLFGFFGVQFPGGELTLFGPMLVGPKSRVGPVFDGVFKNPPDPPDSTVDGPLPLPAKFVLEVAYPPIMAPFPVQYDSALVVINDVVVYKYVYSDNPTFRDPIPGNYVLPDGVVQPGENRIHIEVMGSEYASLIFRVYAIFPVRVDC